VSVCQEVTLRMKRRSLSLKNGGGLPGVMDTD
jgi:hypothetical protein